MASTLSWPHPSFPFVRGRKERREGKGVAVAMQRREQKKPRQGKFP